MTNPFTPGTQLASWFTKAYDMRVNKNMTNGVVELYLRAHDAPDADIARIITNLPADTDAQPTP